MIGSYVRCVCGYTRTGTFKFDDEFELHEVYQEWLEEAGDYEYISLPFCKPCVKTLELNEGK